MILMLQFISGEEKNDTYSNKLINNKTIFFEMPYDRSIDIVIIRF